MVDLNKIRSGRQERILLELYRQIIKDRFEYDLFIDEMKKQIASRKVNMINVDI